MKTKTPFSTKQSTGKNFDVATWGKHAANPLAPLVFSEAAGWPKEQSAVKLGRIEDARVYSLLRILVPALCQRDPGPFRLFADAIENGAAYPASQVHYQDSRSLSAGRPAASHSVPMMKHGIRYGSDSAKEVLPGVKNAEPDDQGSGFARDVRDPADEIGRA